MGRENPFLGAFPSGTRSRRDMDILYIITTVGGVNPFPVYPFPPCTAGAFPPKVGTRSRREPVPFPPSKNPPCTPGTFPPWGTAFYSRQNIYNNIPTMVRGTRSRRNPFPTGARSRRTRSRRAPGTRSRRASGTRSRRFPWEKYLNIPLF